MEKTTNTSNTHQPCAGLYTGSQLDPNPQTDFTDSVKYQEGFALDSNLNSNLQNNTSLPSDNNTLSSDQYSHLKDPLNVNPTSHGHTHEATGGLYTGSTLDTHLHETYDNANEVVQKAQSQHHDKGILEKAKDGAIAIEKEVLHDLSVAGEKVAFLGEKVMDGVNALGDQVANLGKKLGNALHIGGNQPQEFEMKPMHEGHQKLQESHANISIARPLPTEGNQHSTLTSSNHPVNADTSNSGALNQGSIAGQLPGDALLLTNKERYLDQALSSGQTHAGQHAVNTDTANSGSLNQGSIAGQLPEDSLLLTNKERYFDQAVPGEKFFDPTLANELERQDFIAADRNDLELKPSLIDISKEKLHEIGDTIQEYFSKDISSNNDTNMTFEGDISHASNASHPSLLQQTKDKIHTFEEKLKAVMEGDKPLHDISKDKSYADKSEASGNLAATSGLKHNEFVPNIY